MKKQDPLSFELTEEHRKAIETLAAGRTIRVAGRVAGGRVLVDFIACNSPFTACNAPFEDVQARNTKK
jgi:hypothetical protein